MGSPSTAISMGSIAMPHFGHFRSPSAGSGGVTAGSQLFSGMEPILFRRSHRTAPGLPKFIGESRNLVVSKCGDAMGMPMGVLSMPESVLRLFEGWPRMLVSGQMFLLPVLLGSGTMSVRGDVM